MKPSASGEDIIVTESVVITAIFEAPVLDHVHGLLGEYYDASNLNFEADALKVRRIDPNIEFNFGLLPPEFLEANVFSKIEDKILNRDGFEVSGGERSEFRLLQEIRDAQNYDVLLIDEPESSFDNMFLKSDVNQIIKEISESMPVVVVTHNNTVGASVGADYLLYTSKEVESGKVTYRIYSGHPMDKTLKSVDGRPIKSHKIMLNSLEAGRDAYESRRCGYEAIEDR